MKKRENTAQRKLKGIAYPIKSEFLFLTSERK